MIISFHLPLMMVEDEEVPEAREGVLLWPGPLLELLGLLIEDKDEVCEKRERAPAAGGGVVDPPDGTKKGNNIK